MSSPVLRQQANLVGRIHIAIGELISPIPKEMLNDSDNDVNAAAPAASTSSIGNFTLDRDIFEEVRCVRIRETSLFVRLCCFVYTEL